MANKICVKEGVEKEELLTGSRKKVILKCRKIFFQIAVKKMGYSGADVARFLGVTTSAVNRLAAAEKLRILKNIRKLLQNHSPSFSMPCKKIFILTHIPVSYYALR